VVSAPARVAGAVARVLAVVVGAVAVAGVVVAVSGVAVVPAAVRAAVRGLALGTGVAERRVQGGDHVDGVAAGVHRYVERGLDPVAGQDTR
jgi:hypothetical protein